MIVVFHCIDLTTNVVNMGDFAQVPAIVIRPIRVMAGAKTCMLHVFSTSHLVLMILLLHARSLDAEELSEDKKSGGW
jgi:hypothetical protein